MEVRCAPPSDDQMWDGLVGRVRSAVAAAVPGGVAVLVVADGFAPLLQHACRRAANFPQDGHGNPVHHRLHNDQRASWHLEALRAKGFGALVLPETGRWWLDQYTCLSNHLNTSYATIWADESCTIYDVGRRLPTGLRLSVFMTCFEARHGRLPTVLDWNTGANLVDRLSDAPVVTVGAVPNVDYIDQSLDLVVVKDGASSEVVSEARRVATSAVATMTTGSADPGLRLVWTAEAEAAPSRSTLVVDLGPGSEDPSAHLRAITDSVPPFLTTEIIALTDAPLDLANVDERVQIQERRTGGLERLLAVARESGIETAVLLDPLALPVGGGVSALIRTLVAHPEAVAVCGCLIDPFGFLRAAGGVALADGDVMAFGDPGSDPFLSIYRFVRPVTVCPPPLMAIRVGAISHRLDLSRFESREAQYAALSLDLRDQGGVLLYQPEALVIDLRPETGLPPLSAPDKGAVRAQWPSLCGAAPEGRDGHTWYDLIAQAGE